MDRLFLDANILFSSAYKSGCRLRGLWKLANVELLTCQYVVDEARRNLLRSRPLSVADLDRLLSEVSISQDTPNLACVPEDVGLAAKDLPVLAAAISVRATHLLTGDKGHFGHLHRGTIGGVLIVFADGYLRSHGL